MGEVVSQRELVSVVRRKKAESQRIVFTNGCFDLLHPGHIRLLEESRSLGDLLIVGINTDESVRGNKGANRPLIPQQERAEVLASLEPVDYVVTFDEPTPQELIASIVPNVLVKGADWGPNAVVGRAEVESAGGRVVLIALEPGYSTTRIIERIRNTGNLRTLRA